MRGVFSLDFVTVGYLLKTAGSMFYCVGPESSTQFLPAVHIIHPGFASFVTWQGRETVLIKKIKRFMFIFFIFLNLDRGRD